MLFEPDDSEARIAFLVWTALGLNDRYATAYASGRAPYVEFYGPGGERRETPTDLRVKALWLSAALSEPPEGWPLRAGELPPEWEAALKGRHGEDVAEVVKATFARWTYRLAEQDEGRTAEVVTLDGHALYRLAEQDKTELSETVTLDGHAL